MSTDQRILTILPPIGPAAFVELRHDDVERPFHLSIRPAAGRFVINAMQGGTWGEETWHDLPPGFGAGDPILFDRKGRRVALMIGDLAVEWTIRAGSFDRLPHHLHAEGITATWIAPRRRVAIGEGPRLARLNVAGRQLKVPRDAPAAPLIDQQRRAWADEAEWFEALARDGHPDAALPRFGPPLLALAAAGFMPGRAVQVECPDAATAGLLNALARGNGIEGFSARPPGPGPNLPPSPSSVPPAPPRLAAAPRDPVVPGLDIVVALFNAGDFVVECLESLLAGLDPGDSAIRIIVVDDGSTDDSLARIENRFGAEPRIRVVTKPNGGCASARNFGRRVSGRSHIAFVDADDRVDAGFFAALLAVARETGAEVVQGGFARFEGSDPARRWPAPSDPQPDPAADRPICGLRARPVAARDLRGPQAAIWRRVHRRDFLDAQDLWFPESATAFDDLGFEQRLLGALDRVWVVFGPHYLYCQHPAQDVRQGDERHFNSLHQIRLLLDRARDEARAQDDELVAALIANGAWSAGQVAPALLDPFLATLAELVARCHADAPARDWPARARAAIRHPDFAWHLERLLAGPGALTPVFDHPDRLRLWRASAEMVR